MSSSTPSTSSSSSSSSSSSNQSNMNGGGSIQQATSILGAIFGASHHKQVVNLSASVWCPLEKETLTSPTFHRKPLKQDNAQKNVSSGDSSSSSSSSSSSCTTKNSSILMGNKSLQYQKASVKSGGLLVEVVEDKDDSFSPPSSFVSSLSVKELEELTSLLGRATPLSNIETLRVQSLMKQTKPSTKKTSYLSLNSSHQTSSSASASSSYTAVNVLSSQCLEDLSLDELKSLCIEHINQANDRNELLEVAKALRRSGCTQ
jgi:hypothetical protein